MWPKTKFIFCTLVLGFLIAIPANAATVDITAPDTVNVGETFEAEIFGQFDGVGLIAGGITLSWEDTELQLVDVVLKLGVAWEASCPGSASCPPNVPGETTIVWIGFLTDLISPSDPYKLMATVTFMAIGPSPASPLVMIDEPVLTGGWFGAGFLPIDVPQFVNTSVNILGSEAATVTITAPDTVNVGETFEAEILGDFSGVGLIAGGINLSWEDTEIQLVDVALELPVDPDFSCPGATNCPPNVPGETVIVWGEFLSDLINPGDIPPTLMATVTFMAIGPSPASPLVMIDKSDFTGGWFGAGFIPIDVPLFFNTSVNILEPDTVGGTATGVFIKTVTCGNKSTRQKVAINIDGVTDSWDCEAEGLIVNPGDKIDMKVKGTAN